MPSNEKIIDELLKDSIALDFVEIENVKFYYKDVLGLMQKSRQDGARGERDLWIGKFEFHIQEEPAPRHNLLPSLDEVNKKLHGTMEGVEPIKYHAVGCFNLGRDPKYCCKKRVEK